VVNEIMRTKKYGTDRQTKCRVKKDGALHAGLTEAKDAHTYNYHH